jgi:hypothetical protein
MSKHQSPKILSGICKAIDLDIGNWDLEFIWDLEFGYWDLKGVMKCQS